MRARLGRSIYVGFKMRADSVTRQVDGREVKISNPEKVFFAERGITKLGLVDYYLAVAKGALCGIAARPMALKRYPNGAAGHQRVEDWSTI